MKKNWYVIKDKETGKHFWSTQTGFQGCTEIGKFKTKRKAIEKLKKLNN